MASNGRLQFTLEWATLDDLDLNVFCPGGTIDATQGHAGPGICGDGRKDVDANRNLVENVSPTPIENIVWQKRHPVRHLPGRGHRVQGQVEWRQHRPLHVAHALERPGTGLPRCRDALPLMPQRVVNGRVLGGTEKLLTWNFGDPLPDCTFETSDTIRGGAAK